jgi:hypothetical protein
VCRFLRDTPTPALKRWVVEITRKIGYSLYGFPRYYYPSEPSCECDNWRPVYWQSNLAAPRHCWRSSRIRDCWVYHLPHPQGSWQPQVALTHNTHDNTRRSCCTVYERIGIRSASLFALDVCSNRTIPSVRCRETTQRIDYAYGVKALEQEKACCTEGTSWL